jgi:hypothetical protein
LSRVEISRLFTRFFFAQNVCKSSSNMRVLRFLHMVSSHKTLRLERRFIYLLNFIEILLKIIDLQMPGFASTVLRQQSLLRSHTDTVRVARCYIFMPKMTIWVNFKKPLNGNFLYILWPFGIF